MQPQPHVIAQSKEVYADAVATVCAIGLLITQLLGSYFNSRYCLPSTSVRLFEAKQFLDAL